MSNSDFTGLSDDQLTALVRAACEEAARRGAAVDATGRRILLGEHAWLQIAQAAAAALADTLVEEEAQRIARAAVERVRSDADAQRLVEEQSKQRQNWAREKRVGCMVQ